MTLINPPAGEAGQLIELILKYGFGNLFTNWSLIDIARIIKNSFLIIINGYSLLVPLILIIFIVYWIKNKKWPEIVFFLSFFIPFFLTAKFWYGGLYGRYGNFIAYGFALMIALIPNRTIYWLTIISIIVAFIPTFFAYQQKPIPLIQQQLIKKINISNNDLLILSDYQRPQLTYPNGLYLNGNSQETVLIENKIIAALKNGRNVYITQQAINFPYQQYDGQQIHIVSKGDKNKAVLKKFLTTKKLKKIIEDNHYPFLSVYQIE